MKNQIAKYLNSTADAARLIKVTPDAEAVALNAAVKAAIRAERDLRRRKQPHKQIGFHMTMSADKARRLGWKVPADAVAVEITNEPTPHIHSVIFA